MARLRFVIFTPLKKKREKIIIIFFCENLSVNVKYQINQKIYAYINTTTNAIYIHM